MSQEKNKIWSIFNLIYPELILIGEALGIFIDRIKGLIIGDEGEKGVSGDSCDLGSGMVGQVWVWRIRRLVQLWICWG